MFGTNEVINAGSAANFVSVCTTELEGYGFVSCEETQNRKRFYRAAALQSDIVQGNIMGEKGIERMKRKC